MAKQLPRDVFLEFYLGEWTPITARQTSALTVTRGRGDWAGDVSPSRFSVKLDNRAGDLNPDDPLGAYYGLWGRNTPLRYGYRMIVDSFTRSVSNSWGTATSGHVWSQFGSSSAASDWNVAAGKGTQSIDAAAENRISYLPNDLFRNGEVRHTLSLPFANILGASVVTRIWLRAQAVGGPFYYVEFLWNASEAAFISAYHVGTGATEIIPSTAVPAAAWDGTDITMCAQIEGSTLRAKMWKTAADEPYEWDATGTDSDSLLPDAGFPVIQSEVLTGNTNTKPVVFSYDNIEIRSNRFVGFAGRILPKADTSGNDRWVELEGRGIRGRMERNKGDARSAVSGWLPTTSPIAYWPMTGGSLVEAGQSAVPGVADLRPFVGTHPSGAVFASPQWGEGKLGPWLEPGVSRSSGGSLTVLWAPITMSTFTTTWTVDHIYASPTGGSDWTAIIDVNPTYLGGPVAGWPQLIINPAGVEVGVTINGAPEVFGSTSSLFDGLGHHIRWTCTQSGGNVLIVVQVDGATVVSTSIAATLTAITRIGYVGGGTGTIAFAHGHLAIWTSPPAVADAAAAASGYRGEAAGRRLERLCEENGIPFEHIGDLDDTQVMGPQYAEPLLKILDECADTDFGTLVESRAAPGFSYRTGRSLYNQAAGLTVDFSAHQLNDRFDPAYDDQAIRNKVTARRRDGGDYVATQGSGPLNVNDPGTDPDGVGVFDTSVTVNTELDTQLADTAGWQLMLGTTPQARVPAVTVNAANLNIDAALDSELLSMDVDDRLVVENLTSRGMYGDFAQVVRGYTETLDTKYVDTISFVCSPAAPYDVLILDDPPNGKLNTAGSVLHTAATSSATSVDVATTSGPLWTTDAGQMPIPVTISGEDLSVTAVANSVFTFVAAGAAAHADNASVLPGLPAGHTTGDLLVTVAAIRNTAATVSGINNSHSTWHTYGNITIFAKVDGGSESAPTVTFAGGAAGDTTSAFMFALRGKVHDLTNIVIDVVELTNVSAQNIAYPGLDVRVANSVVIVVGWKQDDCTSITALSGMTEILEASTTTGNDQLLVADYVIQTTPTDIAGSSFAVTGGAAAVSKGIALVIRSDRQTFTVTRAENGASKAQAAGAAVRLTRRSTLGR